MSWTDADVVKEVKPQQQAWTDADIVSPAPSAAAKETSWLQNAGNLGAGLLRGASSIGATLLAPADYLGEQIGKVVPDWLKPELSNTNRRRELDPNLQAMGADTESGLYTAGKIGAEIAGTAGTGGILAKGAQTVGAVPSVVRALETYGLQTGLAPKGFVQGAANIGLKAGAGAAAGATTSALIDPEHAGTGAVIGAAIPTIAAPVVRGLSRGATAIYDALSGRLSKIKAADVLRHAAGDDLAAAKAAYARAVPGETAAQATAGIKRDTLDALGEFASVADETSYYSRVADRQKQDMIDAISKIAGGRNQTAARQATDLTKTNLNAITTPMREGALDAANANTATAKRLASEAGSLSDAAASKVGDVRRLNTAGQLAEEAGMRGPRLGNEAPPVPGMVRTPYRYSYGKKLSDLAERLGTNAADDSLILGQAGRFKQMQLESMAQDGIVPLKSDVLIRSLTSMINNPKIGSESLKEKALSHVRDRLAQWTEAGGTIDANAIYGIRKSAVNDAIEQFMGTADPKAKSKAAAGILKEIKPMIDDAIEAAGGTGWRDYLKTFEEGMHQVAQGKMGAKALSLLETSPKKFESLVYGNEPKTVEKIFQTEYDIANAMGNKFEPMQKVASQLARNRSIEEGASSGGTALRGILEEHTPSFKFWNVLDPRVAVINRVLGESEVRIGKAMKDALIEGMKSGKSAEELINTLPTSERMKVVNAMIGQAGVRTAPVIAAQQRR